MRSSSVDQAILTVLSREHAHLTSLQVFEEIRDRLPAVNKSTVYRSLDRLVHNGRVSVSDMGTGAAVYEMVSDGMHHHLVCQNCGKMITIMHNEVQGFFQEIEVRHGFKVATNHLVLFGTCKDCFSSTTI